MLQNEFHWWMFIFRHIIKSIRNTNIPTGYCQSSITISECHSFTFSFRVRTIPAMTSILDTWQWSIPILDTEYYYFSSEAPWSSSLAVVTPSVTGSGSAQRLVMCIVGNTSSSALSTSLRQQQRERRAGSNSHSKASRRFEQTIRRHSIVSSLLSCRYVDCATDYSVDVASRSCQLVRTSTRESTSNSFTRIQ